MSSSLYEKEAEERLSPSQIGHISKMSSSRYEEEAEERLLPNQIGHVRYAFDREMESSLPENFLEKTTVAPYERTDIVNFLVYFCVLAQLEDAVQHLCLAIFDKYVFAKQNVEKKWLVALASTKIASKLEGDETKFQFPMKFVPEELLNLYTAKDVNDMEAEILNHLSFDVMIPTSFQFLIRCTKICDADIRRDHLGMYLIELAAVIYPMSRHNASKLAAAAFCLSLAFAQNETNLKKVWTKVFSEHTAYTLEELVDIVMELVENLVSVNFTILHRTYVYKKFATLEYSRVAIDPAVYSFARSIMFS